MELLLVNKILSILGQNNYSGKIRCGLGESLIYSHLDSVVTYFKKSKSVFKIEFLSNGLALNINKSDYFTNERIGWGVTFDGMVESDIKNLQIGMDIYHVKKNVEEIRGRYPQSRFYLNYTLHKQNVKSLSEYLDFAARVNIKKVFITPLKVFEGHNTELLYKLLIDLKSPEMKILFEQLAKKASDYNLNLSIPENRDFQFCWKNNKIAPVIDIDGAISFCSGRENIHIGNICDENIASKWKKVLFNITKNKTHPIFCKSCMGRVRLEDNFYPLPKSH